MHSVLLTSVSLEVLKAELSEAIKKELPAILAAMHQSHSPAATELLTRKDAARLLGVSLPTLNEWTKDGRVQGYRIASRVRYKRSELEASLSAIKTGRRAT